ncbi:MULTISPECIES: TetR/AcrR family transcriptional regulator [Streptacidiphilus]|uniref:TetR/AcrR family transcriptional regulator n=1 Tax=Streptacidiphilus cavernicola TaxID=3342716 RepID=A0ABV6UK98_9ACTN|nr:TetR/AcrR family transcriptional regulator [Streptacidiphilus jeojiense]
MAEEGLRERKKRQARQHIAETAAGLFLERGFDAVTMAEIAAAADVSVNTVYNYFPAKEDLFLERTRRSTTRLSRMVRERGVGEPAAEAVLRGLGAAVNAGAPELGLVGGYGRFARVVDASPTLKAALAHLRRESVADLEATLRAEQETAPDAATTDDPARAARLPGLVAGQLDWVHSTLLESISRDMVAGHPPAHVARDAADLLVQMRGLLSDAVLGYAPRTEPDSA